MLYIDGQNRSSFKAYSFGTGSSRLASIILILLARRRALIIPITASAAIILLTGVLFQFLSVQPFATVADVGQSSDYFVDFEVGVRTAKREGKIVFVFGAKGSIVGRT